MNARRGRPAFARVVWISSGWKIGDALLGELRAKHRALGYRVDCRQDILSGVQRLPATVV